MSSSRPAIGFCTLRSRGRESRRILNPAFLLTLDSIRTHLSRYVFVRSYLPKELVIDVACGVGYGAAYLRHAGAGRVVAVDLNRDRLLIGARLYGGQKGIGFVCADAQKLPVTDKIADMVVSIETLEHLPDPDAFLREVARVLRPGGVFVCTTANRRFEQEQLGYYNPEHISLLTEEQFLHAVSRYFEHVVPFRMRLQAIDPRRSLDRFLAKARRHIAFVFLAMPSVCLGFYNTITSRIAPGLQLFHITDFPVESFEDLTNSTDLTLPQEADGLEAGTVIAVATRPRSKV